MSDRLAAEIAALKRRVAALEAAEQRRPYGAIYTSNAGQAIPNNTTTVVNYEDVGSDPDSLVTTGAAWAFTAPLPGLYAVVASLIFVGSTAWTPGERGMLSVYRNGALAQHLDRKDNFDSAGAAQFMMLHGAALVALSAGDTLQIRVAQNSGGSLSLNTDPELNYVMLFKVN